MRWNATDECLEIEAQDSPLEATETIGRELARITGRHDSAYWTDWVRGYTYLDPERE